MPAAMRAADRVWTTRAIVRRASAESASQLHLSESGDGRRSFNAIAKDSAERDLATCSERKVVVNAYG